MKKNNFYVFSNDYRGSHLEGGAPTLIGAKRIATKCAYYLDNTWHTPEIYRAEDTELVERRDQFLGGTYMVRVLKIDEMGYAPEPVCPGKSWTNTNYNY